MSLWHGQAAAQQSTNSIELRMTYETSCCSACVFNFLIICWHVSGQLSVLVIKSQVMCVPDPERTRWFNRKRREMKNKRAAVWVIISEQRQRYGINRLLLLSHPSAAIIGGFLQPAFPI